MNFELVHQDWVWGTCPLVARQIACDECKNADARYTSVQDYLALTSAPNLFVYGTLKRGGSNNSVLTTGGARFVGKDQAPDYGTSKLAPLAVRADGKRLHGEVWTNIDSKLWHDLDRLEWAYRRERIVTANGEVAVIYVACGMVPGPITDHWTPVRWFSEDHEYID